MAGNLLNAKVKRTITQSLSVGGPSLSSPQEQVSNTCHHGDGCYEIKLRLKQSIFHPASDSPFSDECCPTEIIEGEELEQVEVSKEQNKRGPRTRP